MTYILVQVAIFLLLYLLCRSIANRRSGENRQEETARAWGEQQAETAPYRRVRMRRRRALRLK